MYYLESMDLYENYSINNYKTGLEILNRAQPFWAYINNSDCLIILNSSFSFNESYCNLNITNIEDFEFFSAADIGEKYYIINSTKVQECYLLNGNMDCNTSFDLSNRNYTSVEGIEWIPSKSLFYVSAVNVFDSKLIDEFNLSFFLNDSTEISTFPPGKMEYKDDSIFLSGNESGNYRLYKINIYSFGIEKVWDYPANETVEGFSYNYFEDEFYYASEAQSEIRRIGLITNMYKFEYQIKDTKLGYPISENFGQTTEFVRAYLPADRNYSVMIYPHGGPAFPVKIDLNNITQYPLSQGPPYYINWTLNLTTKLIYLSGYAIYNQTLNEQNYTSFRIIPFLLEAGNMVFKGATLPPNMGRWRPDPVNDTFNSTTGFYNMTLPGAVLGSNLLLFAVASVNNSGEIVYYGDFKNVTLGYDSESNKLNFTLNRLAGNLSNITVGMGDEAINVQILQKKFKLQNRSGWPASMAHVEVEINYQNEGIRFSWMLDVTENSNGTFELPILFNRSIKSIRVFSPTFAPLKKSISISELQADIINITLSEFRPVDPDGDVLENIGLMMYRSSTECSVPNPPSECYLLPSGEEINLSEFNPFSLVVGGGKLDFEIVKLGSNIAVRYINVDLLASGPPDAIFEENSSLDRSGDVVEEAWRFGSMGPEIYDYVLIKVPYNSTAINESADIKIKIRRFYDENWNTIWQEGSDISLLNSTDYVDYTTSPYVTYINGSGALCDPSESNLQNSLCYKDTTNDVLWFKIPHFSGIHPLIVGE